MLGRRERHFPQPQGWLVDLPLKGKPLGPDRLLVDPRREDADRLGRERVSFARHPVVRVGARDPGNEFAFGRLTYHKAGRTGVAPGECRLAGVEREAPLARGARVALAAVHPQDRHHVMGEVDCPGWPAGEKSDHRCGHEAAAAGKAGCGPLRKVSGWEVVDGGCVHVPWLWQGRQRSNHPPDLGQTASRSSGSGSVSQHHSPGMSGGWPPPQILISARRQGLTDALILGAIGELG